MTPGGKRGTNDPGGAISYMVDVSRLPDTGVVVRIDASERELEALATEHGLKAVKRFHAEFRVARWKRGGVKATGKVEADIVQECVVSLEPLDNSVRENVDAVFVPEGAAIAGTRRVEGGEMLIDFEGEDAPETFSGNRIDLGALAEEFFVLGIDPYPRKPGVTVETQGTAESGDVAGVSPFAALARLKPDKNPRKN